MSSSMEPETIDIRIYAGATWQHDLTWTDDDDDPIDLTGVTAQMELKTDYDAEAILTLTEGDGLTVNELGGIINIKITPEQSITLESSSDVRTPAYVWDIAVKFPSTDVYVAARGSVIVFPRVTVLDP